jgi:hypothetical protein
MDSGAHMKGAIIGHVTATVKDGPDYNSNEFHQFYKDPSADQWVAHSADRKDQENSTLISFFFPDSGETSYTISDTPSNAVASASYAIASPAGYRPFIATSGELTNIELDLANQTVSFDFHFIAESGEKKVMVSEGKCQYENISTSLSTATGTFTAALTGGTYNQYNANQFLFEARPANPVIGPNFPHWQAWSQTYSFDVPNRPLDTVKILIARDLGPGTYDLAELKEKIRVSYDEIYPAAAGYPAESGKLIVESVPEESATQGVFKGCLDFTSEKDSNGVRIQFENGEFTFDSTSKAS